MVKIKKVKVLSAKVIAAFGEQAKKEWHEFRGFRSLFYLSTNKIWVLYVEDKPVCVLGFKRTSLIGTGGEVIFILCKGFGRHGKEVLKFIRRAMRRVCKFYFSLMVRVEEGYWIGEKFVKYFDFHPTLTVSEIGGRGYKIYEMRSSWLW